MATGRQTRDAGRVAKGINLVTNKMDLFIVFFPHLRGAEEWVFGKEVLGGGFKKTPIKETPRSDLASGGVLVSPGKKAEKEGV